ncbi:hypothetical protein ACFQS7_03625 [Dankookia sp. GCM10030260]|uniref:hypothetical protein n=1 Tax=Dankookia sp. GCM10030260 TaxID=3273390 RepID=UPI0036081D65
MRAPFASNGRRSVALLCLLLPLAGCEAMNRVTVLDRIFEPQRFGQQAPPPRRAAAPAPRPPAVPPPAVAPPAEPPTIMVMEPRPDPVPAPAAARPAAPAEDAEAQLRQTVRQHPWLTRFWSELTLTEQARIARQLPPGDDPSGRWDSMGLADRARLAGGTPDERRWASGP